LIYSTRNRLMASLIGVVLAVGGVSLWVGVQVLYRAVVNEAGNRVRQDLNAARMMHDDRVRAVATVLELTAAGEGFRAALQQADAGSLHARLARLAELAALDYAALVLPEGRRVSAATAGWSADTPEGRHPLVTAVLRSGAPAAGTVVISPAVLRQEDPRLASRAEIAYQPAPAADPSETPGAVQEGLSLAAALPVGPGLQGAVIYGGILLNRDTGMVDKVTEAVFHQETYADRPLGTATVFLGDRRVATTVRDAAGERALGTQASADVARRVLAEGRQWTDRGKVQGKFRDAPYI